MQTFQSKSLNRAFSLVEVVIAVAIFAISIVAVIGLLGPTNKSVADVHDTDDATRVVNAIQAQLQNMAEAGQFDAIGSTFLKTTASLPADTVAFNPDAAYVLLANRAGTKIGLNSNTTLWKPTGSTATQTEVDAQKYFEIVLIRNEDLSPNSGSNKDVDSGYLAFTIRLRWPAYTPDGQLITDETQKSTLLVPAAIHR
ncbi:MAG TPA: prepilin-type N-terminal cleavage/methylation domain-containing protein [Rariglobus sp.]|jgi:prepilin-type N-terminal cleavage/methylation domain-containing protein|nr:prepilin-type N-terminal cleavage/methylation domain-containing protein [Rariglobus sp.]